MEINANNKLPLAGTRTQAPQNVSQAANQLSH